MINKSILTVSQLNRYVKSVLEGDFRLKSVFIRGEISNFTDHYKSGHFYFTLKENDAAIKAVMFAAYAQNVPFQPQDGMAVIVKGTVSLYERDGTYQLYVYDMQPEGKGSLQLAYEQLFQKLKAEGLFEQDLKKNIPLYPEKVGLITSDTGAALHDMVNVITRRYPPAKIILYPALVQGKDAPESLIKGLEYFNKNNSCDVIIVGRGGGSLEDLWAFNDENLVRAVANSNIPVISAVGHETDITLCDFAADLRAATPSVAAELAVPDGEMLLNRIQQYEQDLGSIIQYKIFSAKQYFDSVMQRECFKNSKFYFSEKQRILDALSANIQQNVKYKFEGCSRQLASKSEELNLLSPWKQLQRGWTITEKNDGFRLNSVSEVNENDILITRFFDGKIVSKIEKIEYESFKGVE